MRDPEPTQLATRESLAEVFRAAEASPSDFRIGAEGEKFGVHRETGKPLGYGEDFGVCRVLERLVDEQGWHPVREADGGPVIALHRQGASVTLEPGAQLELSGAAYGDLHGVHDENAAHFEELAPISEELGIVWLTTGFHPLSSFDALPWVPKRRYPIMRTYLPTKGSGARDMMQRTATVQANYDWSTEEDALRKMRVALRLSPLIHAMFANAPFKEGKLAERLSERGNVWLNMDSSRSGLIKPLWSGAHQTYDDYVEWALDAGMFLFWRDGVSVENTGQTFRSFLADGFEGHRATLADWTLHLSTLFPEVRLKNTIEVRGLDGLPPDLAMAAFAVVTGILYDEDALLAAEALTESWAFDAVQAARLELVARGLNAPFLGRPSAWDLAEETLGLALAGLSRRARKDALGRDEAFYLEPIVGLVEQRLSPADLAIQRVQRGQSLIEATAFQF